MHLHYQNLLLFPVLPWIITTTSVFGQLTPLGHDKKSNSKYNNIDNQKTRNSDPVDLVGKAVFWAAGIPVAGWSGWQAHRHMLQHRKDWFKDKYCEMNDIRERLTDPGLDYLRATKECIEGTVSLSPHLNFCPPTQEEFANSIPLPTNKRSKRPSPLYPTI